jgi:ATP-binding cassette subfamily F protein 3
VLIKALNYFSDKTNDFSVAGIAEFLGPILETAGVRESEINCLCSELSASHMEKRETSVKITDYIDTKIIPNVTKLDISHVSNVSRPSIVDQRKLKNQERRIAKKKAKMATKTENVTEITTMVVNQVTASHSNGKDIHIRDFDIHIGGTTILKNADLLLANGRRYGLVGKNGVGKSTLLRAIGSGELVIPSHLKVLHIEQEIFGDKMTAMESVLDADPVRLSLLKRENILSTRLSTAYDVKASTELSDIYGLLESIESNAAVILHNLGFSADMQKAPTDSFSAGWRMRLALARALIAKPDLLLADEITNYLDFPSVVWLEKYLREWQGTILLVSHDRSFLESVSTDILHLHKHQLDAYRGSFSSFLRTSKERHMNQLREYEAQLQHRKHLMDFIEKCRSNANAAQAQSKLKLLEKMPPLVAPAKDDMEGLGTTNSKTQFRFPNPSNLSPPILQMDNVDFRYKSDTPVLENVHFDLQMGSKIAVVGPNGAGKSTLMNLLVGNITPTKGICYRHGRLSVGLFSQQKFDQLDFNATSIGFLYSQFPLMHPDSLRRELEKFGLSRKSALQPIHTLSGGQKSRVMFAWIALSKPHVLILDEPTNHLDMDTIEILAESLQEFHGGVVVVSHDQKFLDKVCNEIWTCQNHKLVRFVGKDNGNGIVEQYKQSLL